MTLPLPCSALGILALGFFGILSAGCGGPHSAKVTGQVTLDDQPLTKGDVSFHPADGKGAVAIGAINAEGKYSLSTGTDAGLAPGSYVATVVATEEIKPTRPNEESIFKPITPNKYGTTANSDLKFDVKAGANDIPLKLKSK